MPESGNTLNQAEKQALLEAAQGALPEGGAFVLLPILLLDNDPPALRLKAGEGRLSFVRDIPAFLEALREKEPYPVSGSFTFFPSWMAVRQEAQRLLQLLQLYTQTLETAGAALTGADRRQLPLPPALFSQVLECLEKMRFQTVYEGETGEQTGIQEESLPLLFTLGYDIRGVLLKGAWQADCRRLSQDGAFALINRRVTQVQKGDRALFLALPGQEQASEFSCHFNREETARVFSELLPYLNRTQAVVLEEDLQKRLLRYPFKARVYLDQEGRKVKARLVFVYGDHEVNPFAPGAVPAYLYRDAQGERQIMDVLSQYGFLVRSGFAFLEEDDAIFEFLMKGVADLHQVSEVYLSQAFRQLTPRAPMLSGSLRLKSGGLKLELMDDGTPVEDLLPLISALAQRRKYFRYKSGTFVTLDDAREWRDLAQALLEQQEDLQPGQDLPAMRLHYLSQLMARDQLPFAMDEGTRQTLLLDPEDLKSPVSGLYDYQLRGFRWIAALNLLGLGGILADEMGLGKTAQMIAAIRYFVGSEPQRIPSLIVAPTSLLYNWQTEIERFAPDLSAQVILGSRQMREKALEEALTEGTADVIITSYPLLRQDIALYERQRFRFAVLDEAQNIKNFTSQNARAAKRINAHTRLALTGTPMENSVSELWSLFDFVLPGYLPPARDFLRRFGEGQQAEELKMRIRPFMMRRLKKEVMTQLPDKLEENLFAQMGAEQRRVYNAALLQSRSRVHDLLAQKGLDGSRIEVLAAITLLRQICCHPRLAMPEYKGESAKLELLMEMLPEALKEGRRALIFSQFTGMLKIIRERLDEAGIPSLYLDGETPARERGQLADRFNEGNEPVFLISLKAGGTGLNLTGADLVIHFDPWWNPTAEDQANDRAHRLGQDKTVSIVHLIALSSIEEAVVEMGRRKRRLFDRLITPGEALPQKLSREDVLKLFEK